LLYLLEIQFKSFLNAANETGVMVASEEEIDIMAQNMVRRFTTNGIL
jgi:hypothetical protein